MAVAYELAPVAGLTFSSDSYTGGSVPATFDAFLYKPLGSWKIGGNLNQLKLKIKLRVNLRPVNHYLPSVISDSDDKPFWIRPWHSADWQLFVQDALAQADLWNNRFWLLPPDTFTDFDVAHDLKAWRPNIRCALEVDFSAGNDAHLTIDVANLDTSKLSPGANSSTFRSHSLLWDRLDGTPWVQSDGNLKVTIAHEIGHGIGLGHIGTIQKTPLCELAVQLSQTKQHFGKYVNFGTFPTLDGGRNSTVCYRDGRGSRSNVMAGGSTFTTDNASPWVWAIHQIRSQMLGYPPGEVWTAVTSDPGAGSFVPKKSFVAARIR